VKCERSKKIDVNSNALTQTNIVPSDELRRVEAINRQSADVTKKTLTKTKFIDSDYVKELKEAVNKYTPQKTNLTKNIFTRTARLKGLRLMKHQIIQPKPMQASTKAIVEVIKAYNIEPRVQFEIFVYGELPAASQERLEYFHKTWHRDIATDKQPLTVGRLDTQDDQPSNGLL
jgi:hypothetical protein